MGIDPLITDAHHLNAINFAASDEVRKILNDHVLAQRQQKEEQQQLRVGCRERNIIRQSASYTFPSADLRF